MHSPELSLDDLRTQVDAARGERNGATMRHDDLVRQQELIRRETDEAETAKQRAGDRLRALEYALRMREGIPREALDRRARLGKMWSEINASEDPVKAQAAVQGRLNTLATYLRMDCPHPFVIGYEAMPGVPGDHDVRECVICLHREYRRSYALLPAAELRDMPERTVVTLTTEEFSAVGGEFVELPDCAAIEARFQALVARTPPSS